MTSVPIPGMPWKQVGIDICSLQTTPDGYICMVVMVDYFTKWIEAKPLQNKTAKSVAVFIYETICRHGVPRVQINDQGREFVNKVSEELHALTGVQQRITSAYHPQANGLVERNNRTIQTSLLKVLEGKNEEWPKALPGVLFAFNTSRQKSTGFSAFYLMYGRNAVLPVDIVVDTQDEEMEEPAEDYESTSLQARLQSISHVQDVVYPTASDNITTAQDRQQRDYQKRHSRKTTFTEGDLVLVWNSRRADRKGGKSVDPWNGPYIVKKSVGQGLYEVGQTDSSKVLKSKVNATNMKGYTPRVSASGTPPKPQEKKKPKSESTDVQVTRCEENPISFVPTDAPWRKFACQKLDIAQPKGRFPKRSPPGSLEKLPAKIDRIEGDGNCLFRAISKEVSGTEQHHRTIRSQVVQVLGDERYSKHFQGYSGHRDMREYLLTSEMNNNAVWATDVEIVAVASLLNTAVVIHTEDRQGQRRWMRYEPLCVVPPIMDSNCMIYLTNYSEHFNRVM